MSGAGGRCKGILRGIESKADGFLGLLFAGAVKSTLVTVTAERILGEPASYKYTKSTQYGDYIQDAQCVLSVGMWGS